jgi:ribulose bisphosphate carboxylase small subunit
MSNQHLAPFIIFYCRNDAHLVKGSLKKLKQHLSSHKQDYSTLDSLDNIYLENVCTLQFLIYKPITNKDRIYAQDGTVI